MCRGGEEGTKGGGVEEKRRKNGGGQKETCHALHILIGEASYNHVVCITPVDCGCLK